MTKARRNRHDPGEFRNKLILFKQIVVEDKFGGQTTGYQALLPELVNGIWAKKEELSGFSIAVQSGASIESGDVSFIIRRTSDLYPDKTLVFWHRDSDKWFNISNVLEDGDGAVRYFRIIGSRKENFQPKIVEPLDLTKVFIVDDQGNIITDGITLLTDGED